MARVLGVTGYHHLIDTPPRRYLVKEARVLGLTVLDRCNLTVLLEPGQEDLASFLAENQVQVVASLPCYGQKNVDQQRGAGVFERSIAALQVCGRGMAWDGVCVQGRCVKGVRWDGGRMRGVKSLQTTQNPTPRSRKGIEGV